VWVWSVGVKKNMKKILRENWILITVYLTLLSAGIVVCIVYPKGDIHLYLNRFHSKPGDIIFKYLTYIGDGLFSVAVVFILLFIRFRYALMVLTSYLSSGLLVQVMKHFIFPDSPRPALFLKDSVDLYLIPGIDLHLHHSFPSGHSASAFALLITLALIIKKRWAGILLLLMACFVAWSRVYISQHFLIDIIAGSIPGFLAALIFYWYFHGLNKKWPGQSIVTFFR